MNRSQLEIARRHVDGEHHAQGTRAAALHRRRDRAHGTIIGRKQRRVSLARLVKLHPHVILVRPRGAVQRRRHRILVPVRILRHQPRGEFHAPIVQSRVMFGVLLARRRHLNRRPPRVAAPPDQRHRSRLDSPARAHDFKRPRLLLPSTHASDRARDRLARVSAHAHARRASARARRRRPVILVLARALVVPQDGPRRRKIHSSRRKSTLRRRGRRRRVSDRRHRRPFEIFSSALEARPIASRLALARERVAVRFVSIGEIRGIASRARAIHRAVRAP